MLSRRKCTHSLCQNVSQCGLLHPTNSRFRLFSPTHATYIHTLCSQHILFASLVLRDVYFICAVSLCCNSLRPLLLLSLQLHCYVSSLKRTLCPQQQVSNCHFSCSTVVHTLYPSSGEGLKPDSCSKHHLAQKTEGVITFKSSKKSINENGMFARDLTCTCTTGCSIITFGLIQEILLMDSLEQEWHMWYSNTNVSVICSGKQGSDMLSCAGYVGMQV